MTNIVKLKDFEIANNLPFVLVAGPCQIETLDHALFMADKIKEITEKHGIPFVYKSSYDKANRTSANSKRGVGIDLGLEILQKVKDKIGCPLVTDVHNEEQARMAGEVVDIVQIPALLCRQTDLLKSAADTGKIVKVKKGQFMAPWDMKNVYEKLVHFDAKGILLTDRGTAFGYNTLVSDMRGLEIMANDTGAPIFFDATHSVQKPSSVGNISGGERQFVSTLARAAVAVGVAGLFFEVHQDPDNAPSDGPCMLRLDSLDQLLGHLKKFDQIRKSLYNDN